MTVVYDRKDANKKILKDSTGKVCFPNRGGLLELAINNWNTGTVIPDSLFDVVINKDKFAIVDINDKKYNSRDYTVDIDNLPIFNWEVFKGKETVDVSGDGDFEEVYTEEIRYTTLKLGLKEDLWLDIDKGTYISAYKILGKTQKSMPISERAKYSFSWIKKYFRKNRRFVNPGWDVLHSHGYYTLDGYEEYFIYEDNIPTYGWQFEGKLEVVMLPNTDKFKEEFSEVVRAIENYDYYFKLDEDFEALAKKMGAHEKYDGKGKTAWYISDYIPESEDGYRRGCYLETRVTKAMVAKHFYKERYEGGLKALQDKKAKLIDENSITVTVLDISGAEIIE